MKKKQKSPEFSPGRDLRIVLVTVPDIKTARRLARAALEARLVACANIVPRLESHYWWQGKIETGKELLVLFKTSRHRVADLANLVDREHPYDTPEFVTLPVHQVSPRYGDWWRKALAKRASLVDSLRR